MRPVILVSMNVAPVGGLTNDVLKCVRALRQQDREVHVIYGFRDPRTLAAVPDPEVHWHRMYMPKRPPVLAQTLIWAIASLMVRCIRKTNPDALVVCFERLPIGDVQIGTAPNELWLTVRKRMGLSPFSKLPYQWWCAWMDRQIQYHSASTIVLFSERDKSALLARGVDAARLVRAVMPTDTKRFQPQENSDRPYVTIIGVNPKLKGVDLALKIWPAIAKRHPDLRLRIVTHGWKVRRLVSTDIDNIEVADFIPRVEDYYHSSRLVLMPSMFETWGNVVPEALACGVPVVTSSDVPSSEIITSPEMGDVFQRDGMHDAEWLESAVEQALELKMDQQSMKSRHKRVEDYMQEKDDLVTWLCDEDSR